MAEPKPPPSADRLRRFPRALPAGLGGSPALLAPGFRVSAWNQVWNQAPFLGAGFRSRFRGICSRSRGSGPVSHGPFLTARLSGLVRQGSRDRFRPWRTRQSAHSKSETKAGKGKRGRKPQGPQYPLSPCRHGLGRRHPLALMRSEPAHAPVSLSGPPTQGG